MDRNLKREIIANRTVCKLIIHDGVLAQEGLLDQAMTGQRLADQVAVLRQMVMVFAGTLEALSEADARFATSIRGEARTQLVNLAKLEARSL